VICTVTYVCTIYWSEF